MRSPAAGMRAIALALGLLVAIVPVTSAATKPAETALERLAAAAPGDRIADLAASLEYDLERIYRFVADEIAYEPYAGILRGAEGALRTGAGNSVDQALLVAALLDESLIPYRFARGVLDEEASARLAEAAIMDAASARSVADRLAVTGLAEAVVSREPTDAAGASAAGDGSAAPISATSPEVDATVDRARARLDETAGRIEGAMAEAGIELPAGFASLPGTEVEAHVWVQASLGAEWLDLEPSLPGLEPGASLAEAAETLDTLPDDLRYVVDFRVIVEEVRGDQLVAEPILELSAFADRVAGLPITFGHIKPTGLEQLGITVRNILGNAGLQYNAVADVAGESIIGDMPVAFGISDGEGGGGLFEGTDLFDETDPGPGPADGEATAEWLEVTLSGPGLEPATARRVVFDRLPAEVRYAGEPTVEAVQPIETVDLDGSGELDVPAMLGLQSFAVATGPTPGATLVARATDPDVSPLASMALAYHYLRDALATELLLPRGLRPYLDAPNIVSVSLAVEPGTAEAVVRTGLDIWHRSQGTLALPEVEATASPSQLVAGILHHVVERTALDLAAVEPDEASPTALGVSAVFDAAAAAGVPTLTLRDAIPADVTLGAQARALVDEALAAGDVVVIPARPVTLGGREVTGWWRVDPVTGTAVDVLDDGSGSETTEYQLPLTWEFRAASCVLALSGAILAGIVEILDIGGFSTAKHAVAIGGAIFQAFSAARGWLGSCR